MQATSKLDLLAYDANTITAGDFTVELDINRYQYAELKKRYEGDTESQKLSLGIYLKQILMTEVSGCLTASLKKKEAENPDHFNKDK